MRVEIVVPLLWLAPTVSCHVAVTNYTNVNWKQWTHAQGLVMTWFKIDQMGLWDSNLNSENWGTAIVLKQLKWSNKIPSNLKPRKYIPLYELLALCQANTPQFYFDCAQVVMEGSGTANATFVYFQIGIYQGGHPSEDPPGGAVWSGCE